MDPGDNIVQKEYRKLHSVANFDALLRVYRNWVVDCQEDDLPRHPVAALDLYGAT